MVTEFYYWDTNREGEHNETSEYYGLPGFWRLVEESEILSTNPGDIYANWTLNQTYFIDYLAKAYGPANVTGAYVPDVIKMDVSIHTFDPASMNSNVTDNFTLEIFSNGDLASDSCNFTTLVISNPFGDRVYNYTVGSTSGSRRRNLQQYNDYYNQYDSSSSGSD